MPPRFPIPAYCCECSVLKRAQLTRFAGQIIDGGETRNLLAMPPMEKPISWVDITTIHWSNGEDMRFGQYHWRDKKIHTDEVVLLVIINSLNGYNICLRLPIANERFVVVISDKSILS